MKYELKTLEKSQVELTIIVEPSDYKKDMDAAAVRISERAAIKGFRPGKATYNMVKQQVGEIRIIEEAMQSIVEKNFFDAVKKEKLDTVGMPAITITKVAPGNDLEFKAVVGLLPVIKLGNLSTVKVKHQAKEITDADVDTVLNDLKKMQTKEILKNGEATKEDKLVVNLEMFLDKVPVEGGQAPNHQVYLAEPHYIPGLAEQLIGVKKDDVREFNLKFPKDHYQKHLAGKDIDFKVKINEVFELQHPPLDDAFAKTLGQENMEKLKTILRDNLIADAKHKDDQKLEIEILDNLIEASEISVIPDVLINAEKHKIFNELKNSLGSQGIEMEQYLKDLKKTEEDIYKDFQEQAMRRVKAALVSRQVAIENKIEADKKDVEEEIKMIKAAYPDNKNVEENLKNPQVLETLALTIQNRKVLSFLKDKIVGKK
ncbi:MAG: Trigger factor [Candidatus Magasanikbacteria bacterium GW2011_GWA2_40_10]|uniref:Trigger factor n=1 Tax=Candidatus Magasanikbacteria bacterium GW2011_GWA2_40_10 TaxID=1619037 RepID=A0A0G0TAE8_9BACT|nr:MAG: Trigger factor [Candidatus Magasanikbacteria bacterium GW2011_GWA2_40_10]